MRKLIILLLAFAITACGAPPPTSTEAPTEVVAQPTQTALVLVETVVVTVVPTNVPTEVPSATAMPAPTQVPPTAVPPTQAVAAAATEAPAGGPIALDNVLGAGWFVDMTRSGDKLALRCQLYRNLTFYVKATDPNITAVDFFYRIVDKSTGTAYEWQNAGRMIADGSGGFSLTFAGDQVHANYRKPSAWLDFQFAGSNNTGVVGRSEKIEKQINYMFDCP